MLSSRIAPDETQRSSYERHPKIPDRDSPYFVGEVDGRVSAFIVAGLLVVVVGLGYFFFYRTKTASSAVAPKSIAVLPLKPIDAASRDEVFEMGIADSLINRISSMNGLKVRRLSATSKYANLAPDPIVAELEQQVDYTLEWTYQLADGKIRVTAKLINVTSEQIEGTLPIVKDARDVLVTQDEIARETSFPFFTVLYHPVLFFLVRYWPVAKLGLWELCL